MKTFAITDIHGCNKTFKALLEQIGLSKDDELILLGDYVDRGPDSKGVLDTILDLQQQGYNVTCLLGNHEEVVLRAFIDPESNKAKNWIRYHGGDAMLRSFGIDHVSKVPSKYIDLLRSFPHYYEKENYIFVHAGLNLQLKNPFTDSKAMIWTKKEDQYIDKNWLGDRIVVHGHSPQDRATIDIDLSDLKQRPFIGIDNGCVYSIGNLGHLCALNLEKQHLFFEPNID